MKIKQMGSNQTLLKLNDNLEVFFSYETPVAGYDQFMGFFCTEEKFSRTTSKHIRSYLDGLKFTVVSQDWIEDLVK